MTTDQAWTTRRLLAWMGGAFKTRGIDSPRLMAELLLAHVLGCDKLRLYTDADRPASPDERDRLRALVQRALDHEPIQYLTGEAWFFGMAFHADRRALIPRPSTETIVETVLQHARARRLGGRRGESMLIADVCTGSGCIAAALLKHLPGARAVACDIDPDALALARRNAERHGVADRLDLLEGDLLSPLAEFPATRGAGSLDYLVSNPPYIPDDEWAAVESNVKDHEPARALRGGADGLDLVRPIVGGAGRFLKAGGLLMVEVAASRAGEARRLASEAPGLAAVRVLKDIDGLDRVIAAERA